MILSDDDDVDGDVLAFLPKNCRLKYENDANCENVCHVVNFLNKKEESGNQ